MTVIKTFAILTLATLFLLFSSCDRRTEPVGPDLIEIFGEFEVIAPLSISNKTVDFSTGETMVFKAKFTTLEEWKIVVTGFTSGAVYQMSGFSSTLDQDNAKWIGNATILPIFRKENCSVELTIVGQTDVFRDTITIAGVKINQGVLVTDFENGISPDWPFFYQSGVSFFADNGAPAAQGNYFLNAKGTVGWDFLIGLIEFPALNTIGVTHFPLSTNPNKVYFNVMVYGEQDKSNSFIIFRFREDDNGNGTWEGANEDMWASDNIYITWDGWQLISIPYNEMVLPPSGDGATGNQTGNPDKILSVEYLLLSDPTEGATRSNLDYLFFSEDGPLRP